MEARITCKNRDVVIQILEHELGITPVFQLSPSFSCRVGDYTILRDGRILAEENDQHLRTLAALGLCDYPAEPPPVPAASFLYPMEGHSGHTLFNLMCILSARQYLINPAFGLKRAVFVSRPLIDSLCAHPPASVSDFLVCLYGRNAEFGGVEFSLAYIVFSGFRKVKAGEAHLCRQLADHIMESALNRCWTKPTAKNIRNKKYAMRMWMNALGMSGPEYEEARRVFLGRLPGSSNK